MIHKLLLLFLLLPVWGFSKDFQVKLNVSGFPKDNKLVLLSILNGNTYVVDSLPVVQNEVLTFKVPENTHTGMLQVLLGSSDYDRYMNRPPKTLVFLFDKEDIELSFKFEDLEDIQVIKSQTNKEYFDFLKKDGLFYKKLGTLEQVLVNYPDKDEFYELASEYYERFQREREELINNIYKTKPSSLAAKVIHARKMPFLEGNTPQDKRDSIFKARYLAVVDFSDTVLLYTNMYTDKIYQYLNMFFSRAAGPRENEQNMIKAVDNLFPCINVNGTVRDNLMQFLITSFESMKMEEVLAHISSTYAQQCGSSVDILAQRLEKYKKMAIGNTVPDFVVMDINNNPLTLYGSVNPYNLLVFWHSDCSHCAEYLKGLSKLMAEKFFQNHHVNVIGVSIDEKRENWEKYSQENKLEWVNTYTEGAFESQVTADFNIFATPTIFLLDSEHKILAKPLTIEELVNDIEKLK